MVRQNLYAYLIVASLLTPIVAVRGQEVPTDQQVAPAVSKEMPQNPVEGQADDQPVSATEPVESATPPEQDQDVPAPPSGVTEVVDGPNQPAGQTTASRPQFQIPSQPKATVDESSGALTYQYPIEMPPGRGGMTPELAFSYDSREVSRPDSIVGLGWDVKIPSIKREPIEGTQNLYSKAYFSSSMSGNLIATTDTTQSQYTLYRVEADDGDYSKYTYNPDNSWTATGKDGRTYRFGVDSTSRQDNPLDSSQVYRWMLSEISDTVGNKISYSFTKDNGQIYPNQIIYADHPSAPAVNTITFSYTNPPNYGSTVYNSAFPVTTFRLMTTITIATVMDGQTATRTYTLSHQNAQFVNQKLVKQINRNIVLPSVEYNQTFTESTFFEYGEKQPGWEQGTHYLGDNLPYITETIFEDIFTADFDKNGFQDVLVSHAANGVNNNKLNLNDGHNFIESGVAWSLPNEDLDSSFALLDVNGDQLPDFHYRNRGQAEPHPMYLNTGSGFILDTSGVWEIGNYIPEALGCGPNVGDGRTFDMNAFYHDMNGDKKKDILYFGGTSDFRVFLYNGNGYTRSFAYTFTPAPGTNFVILPRCTGNLDLDNYQTLIDLNGDGLEDYHHEQYGTYLSTGTGFAYSAAYDMDIDEMDRSGFADINGDGLIDYVGFKRYSGDNRCAKVLFNNGSGFSLINPIAFPPCDTNTSWNPSRLAYVTNNPASWGTILDVTADGFPDVIGAMPTNSVTGRVRAINNERDEWVDNSFTSDPWKPIVTPSYGKFLEINNDGIIDFISPNTTWDGTPMAPSKVYLGKSAVPNRLIAIRTPLRLRSEITYGSSQTDRGDTNASPMPVVKRIAIQDLAHAQPEMVTGYDYTEGQYHIDSATGQKRFAGFHKVVKTESGSDLVPLRISETSFHQANGADAGTNEPPDNSLALIGRPYYSIVHGPSASPKKETWARYDTSALTSEPTTGRKAVFVRPVLSVTRSTDAKAAVATAESLAYDTAVGEVIQRTKHGFVIANNNGSFTDIPGDSRYEFMEYAVNVGATIVKPRRMELRSGPTPETTVTRTDHYYDNQPFGIIGSLGLMTSETKWIEGNGATTATSLFTYDALGNLLTSTNPRGAVTTKTYDASKSLVASESNHLGHLTTFQYMTGLLKQVTDPNGRVTSYGYSTSGWLYRTTVANTGGNQSTFQFLEWADAIWVIRTDKELVNSILDRSWQTIDSLGRPVRTIRRALDHRNANALGFYLKSVKEYDSLGREVRMSSPYGVPDLNSEVGLMTVSVPSNLFTTTSFDVFDRPVQIANSIGTTGFAYSGAETTVTDANSNLKKTATDAYGNLARVTEFNDGAQYVTDYGFDVRDKLTSIRDAAQNVRTFTYNNAGWMTRAEDLHRPNDPTFGVTTFTYDLNGNVLSETQPIGIVVSRTFDLLDRVQTLNSSSTTGTDFGFAYDTCVNGKGRVCGIAGNLPNLVTIGKSFVYGISGVPTSMTFTLNGQPYTTSYEYNRSDEVSRTTYPNGTQVRTDFGEWALPASVYVTLPGGNESTFASLTYHHTEKMATIASSGGVVTTYAYDAAKLHRLASKVTNVNASPLQSFAYSYDAVNNITQVIETGFTKTYSYDDLNRLVAATHTPTSGSARNFTYAYDALGNITRFNGRKYEYGGTGNANPHAVTKIGFSKVRYDANGNLTSFEGRGTVYNWQNQAEVFIAPYDGGNATAAYDETGRRFLYQTAGGFELEAGPNFLLRNNVPEIDIEVRGTAIGVLMGSTAFSTIADHLGSPLHQLGSSGQSAEDTSYDPFGATIAHSGQIDVKRGYTGHQEDKESGLVYANARYYDPRIGRFCSADPISIRAEFELSDPQSHNSFAYSRNNPIRFVDPNGKWFWDVVTRKQSWSDFVVEVGDAANYLYNNNRGWKAAMDHPVAAGAVIGVAGGVAAVAAAAAAPTIAAAAPAVTKAEVAQSVVGGALNTAGTYFNAKIEGRNPSAAELGTSFAFGAAAPRGSAFTKATYAGATNAVQQVMFRTDDQKMDLTSIISSSATSFLGAKGFSKLPDGGQLNVYKFMTEQVVVWTADTAVQSINTGIKTESEKRKKRRR